MDSPGSDGPRGFNEEMYDIFGESEVICCAFIIN